MSSAEGKHVFISYVREDTEQVDLLCTALDAAGIPYWRDVKDLWPGDQWKSVIREAIRSGTLVFLACFSDQSRGRDRSYQNEELYLAIEEMRQMPPARPWLIPVRLDDGPVPDFEVRPGLTLGGLNRVDFFGPGIVAASSRLAATIHRIMGTPGPDTATVAAAVSEADAGQRTDLLRRTTKELLLDPARRIQLDDLVAQEVARVLQALRDPDRFPLQVEPRSVVEILAQEARSAEAYAELLSPLLASLHVAARWAEPVRLGPWASGIRAIANAAEEPRAGLSSLLALRRLPVVLLIWTAAVSAISTERWDNLRALVVDVNVAYGADAVRVAALEAYYPWRAFDSNEDYANVVARTTVGGLDLQDAATAVAGRKVGRYKSPISDWLYVTLKPIFLEQFPEEALYAQAVDRAEAALGVVSQDQAAQRQPVWGQPHSSWFGRATYTSGWSNRTPVDDLADEASSQGSQWVALTAGLFGADPSRARDAIEAYREQFNDLARHRT